MWLSDRTAERYVKNVSVNQESSHNKILAKIRRGSTVLEFGPASGAMTQVLCQEYKCCVSIVEVDTACFEKVMEYADDGICTDIETFEWLDKFRNKKFDYIIFADVLEHLRNPDIVLEKVKQLLETDGSVMISVPNIAHNSVIIQLLKNQFIYQSTGILDYTHVRHFTYSEIEKLCIDSGYGVVYMDGIYIGVGKNEFDISYGDIEPLFADMLKKRPFGEVYQHILELKTKEFVDKHDIKIENCLGLQTEYADLVFDVVNTKDIEDESNNHKIVELLYSNPNYFFNANDEIARMRLEINELYLAQPELSKVVRLREQIYQCREEIREKNRHIQILFAEEEKKEQVIVKLNHENKRRETINLELESKNQELENKSQELENKSQELENKSQELENKSQELERKNQELENKNQELESRNQELENKNQELEESNLGLKSSRINLENQKLDLESRKREIEDRNGELENQNVNLKDENADLKQTIRNKEGHIELLLAVERIYEHERQTHAYKFAKKLQRFANVLLPLNSRRRFFARIVFNIFRHPRLMLHVINPKRIKNYLKYMKLEGMEGVKKRYEEAVDTERMQMHPAGRIDLNIEDTQNIEKGIEDYEKLTFPIYSQIEVSIIIPVYNEFDYTYNCLKSILKHSGDVAYEIIIANDCSTDITNEIEKIAENVRLVTTKENVRFLLNCNYATQFAKGKYILFLNNDTQVQENWLKPLVDLIERDGSIGMVGSKLVYPDGYLQEAGGIVWKDASAWNYGNRKSPEEPEFNYVKEVDYISGAAIMLKSELWEEIGGFDERFVPAYYEDTDLAFEVRKRNYKVMYQPLSVVVHFEGISNGTDLESGLKQYQQVNYQKFYDKWREVLQKEQESNGSNVFTAKDRSNHKKHILVVDHYVPHHDQDAGGKCTYMYLKLFVKLGFKVTFIGDNFYKHEPYTTELNQMGIEVLYGNFYCNNWQNWLKENSHYFDYIYLQRPHIAVKYIDLVKQYSKAKVLYFAHDLHHIREYREYEMTKDSEKLKSSENWKKIEYELFEKADVGHVVGSYEQKIMQEAFPNKPIRNIPLYIYDKILMDVNKNFEERQDILYVGGFGYPPNIDAVLWFAREIYPLVLQKYPQMKWHIVGGKATKEIESLKSENIIVEGFVSDEVLEKLYRKCRLAVVPLRFGAGVKGKVVEAAYFQIPLVTTSIGAEGLNLSEQPMLVEDDGNKMAELICRLYEDYDRLRKMSDDGIKFIERNFMLSEAERIIRLDIVL